MRRSLLARVAGARRYASLQRSRLFEMTTFVEFLAEVEHEAERVGPEAVSEINVLQIHWRAQLAEMKERFQRKGEEFCVCGLWPGKPAYRPHPALAWRHASHCPHALRPYALQKK